MLLWSSTEVLVTIICACIPVLRPLYVKFKYGSRGDSSSSPSYPLSNYRRKSYGGRFAGGDDALESGTDRIYSGPEEGNLQTKVKMGSENASDESILRDRTFPIQTFELVDQPGIKRTDEIRVETCTI